MPIQKLLIFVFAVCLAWWVTTRDLLPAPVRPIAQIIIVVVAVIWIIVHINGLLHCCTI